MTIKVKNVKINEINFDKKNFKDFDKCIEYVKLIDTDYKKYLPKNSSHCVEFELIDTNADFANCIRRFLLDEIYINSMHVDVDDIVTNDNFILSDLFKKNIELIPFTQRISDEEIKDINISLNITNTTDDIINIYSRDITITDKKNNQMNVDNYFSGNIPLITLHSNKSIECKKINIVNGCGKEDAGKFCLLSNLSYEILDVIPLDEQKFNRTGHSSLISDPQHFKLSYKTHRNIEPKTIMHMCCNQLINRLQNILKEFNSIKDDSTSYFSDLLEVELKEDVKLYHFKNEYWTIGNIIARYGYLEFKDVKFICSCIIHPSIEESIVKIIHGESTKILKSAIKKILDDLEILKKAF